VSDYGRIATVVATSLVGCGVMFAGVRAIAKGRRMARWPSTAGTISRSYVVERRERDQDVGVQRIFSAEIEFDYAVNGVEYRGKTASLVRLGSTMRRFAEGAVKQYPVGRSVTVYYDPERPADSVIRRDDAAGWGWLFVIVGAAIFAGAAIYATFFPID